MTIKSLSNSINSHALSLPCPVNINAWWNLGSIVGTCLCIQLISGFILSMNYCPNIILAFNSIIDIMNNTQLGWLIRSIHINTASLFFLTMFMHIFRGIYNQSHHSSYTWMVGIMILLLSMMTAFMGYILPWGQMSYWGATVITNLISVIPYLGPISLELIWGAFSVDNATLNRFFSLHFLLPFLILMMVFLHLLFLHKKGSSNPLGLKSSLYMIPFHPYYMVKDLVGILLLIIIIMFLSTQTPDILIDPDNFTIADPLKTPLHIMPEWYFLHSYAILRSIPNKLGGVIMLIMSILILMIFIPMPTSKMKSTMFYPINSMIFWLFLNMSFTLMWLGSKPMVYPYMYLCKFFSIMYFLFFITSYPLMKWQDNMLYQNIPFDPENEIYYQKYKLLYTNSFTLFSPS